MMQIIVILICLLAPLGILYLVTEGSGHFVTVTDYPDTNVTLYVSTYKR